MIKAKALKIIEVFNTEDILTLNQLVQRTGLKKHDIRQMIDRINHSSELLGCYIEAIRTRGYKLLVLDKHKFIMSLKEMSLRINRLPLKVQVTMKLMNSNGVCKYKDLEEEFFISRSKVDSLITKINEELSEYQVKVVNEKYKGFSLLGDERMIRKYLIENELINEVILEILAENSYESRYMNLALVIQRSRIQTGHGLNANTFSLVQSTISESEMLGTKGYSYTEQKYAQDLYRMTQITQTKESIDKIIMPIKAELNDFYTDDLIYDELSKVCAMVEYCAENSYIPVNIYGAEVSYFAESLTKSIKKKKGITCSAPKLSKLSQLTNRVSNYILEMGYSTRKVEPHSVAIVNTWDKLALNQITYKLKRLFPTVNITICDEKELYDRYDFILIFEMLQPNILKVIDPSKVINVSWRGRISSEEELLSHINTYHLTQFLRKYLVIEEVYAAKGNSIYEYKHFKLEYDNELRDGFIYIPNEERVVIAKSFIDQDFEHMYMVDSFVKKMVAMNNSMLNKKGITIEDIVNLIRKI